MSRRFLVVTLCLTATIAFLVGLIVAGSMTPAPAVSSTATVPVPVKKPAMLPLAPHVVSFADIAERLNPAVVNIDATSRGNGRIRRRFGLRLPDTPNPFERPFDGPQGRPFDGAQGRPLDRERDGPRRGTGTGFIINPEGYILTNHHVIEGADRLMVRLTDGRSLRAEPVGSDPDTDIALVKIDSPRAFQFAPLGNSDSVRVGEWVVAIGNPLAYEHTVTVGVISFIGRKLFDSSLDHYIQTDAAINFGNSGGPLINASGEVIGINAAISSRAANIGFAVPINQASLILPQLREKGRVSRGYIGVALRDIDSDLQRSLSLKSSEGALVQDVTPGSPGARAGVRTYDVIVAVDGRPVVSNDALIQVFASRQPGTIAMLQIVRDGRALNIPVKLAERPLRDRRTFGGDDTPPQPSSQREPLLGLSVRDIDPDFAARFKLPQGTQGVIVSRVDPMSPAFDADIERGHILLEINRQPVHSIEDYRRITTRVRPGDVLTLYLYKPELEQRALQTVTIDER